MCLYWLRFLLQENSSFSVLRTAGVLCECLTNIRHLVLTVRCVQVHFDGSGLKTLPSGTFSSQLFCRCETKVSTWMLVCFFICFQKATGERTSNPLVCKYALFGLLCSPFLHNPRNKWLKAEVQTLDIFCLLLIVVHYTEMSQKSFYWLFHEQVGSDFHFYLLHKTVHRRIPWQAIIPTLIKTFLRWIHPHLSP